MAKGGRIVLTTSDTHDPKIFPSAPKQVEVRRWAQTPDSASSAYAASKLGNLLTAEGIAALPDTTERQITTIALNPGLTGGTGLSATSPDRSGRSFALCGPSSSSSAGSGPRCI